MYARQQNYGTEKRKNPDREKPNLWCMRCSRIRCNFIPLSTAEIFDFNGDIPACFAWTNGSNYVIILYEIIVTDTTVTGQNKLQNFAGLFHLEQQIIHIIVLNCSDSKTEWSAFSRPFGARRFDKYKWCLGCHPVCGDDVWCQSVVMYRCKKFVRVPWV